jgi:cytoskeletal protein CcmA (bactofilin family)
MVEGNVEVARVIVHGEVRGDILARDKVELGSSARVSGNVSYGVIEMAAGALIQGRLVSCAGGATPEPAAV